VVEYEYNSLQAISQLTADYINRVLPHMHADHKGVHRDIAERQYLQVCMAGRWLALLLLLLIGGAETSRIWTSVLSTLQGTVYGSVMCVLTASYSVGET